MRWLHEEKGCKLNRYHTGEWAGLGGSVDVFEYLLGKGYEFDTWACYAAARGGHVKALKFLRSQDPSCPWNVITCGHAAQGGSLEALKWLRDQDPPCPWGESVCTSAAKVGHLEVLKWLRAKDPPCPWGESTCYDAAKGGQLEVLKWLRAQDPPCRWLRSYCRETASQHGHQHIVDWIDERQDESDDEEFIYSDMESSDSD